MLKGAARVVRGPWLVALYGVLSGIICAPLFEEPNGLGVSDWDVHLFYYGAVVESVVEYGQPPFWNPWYCGGNVLWQNPQVALLSPVYPLATVVSLPLAMKITIFAHYWIGFIGSHLLLTRAIGLTFVPLVVFLATLGTASSALALHLAVGHVPFLAACYVPWLVWFLIRALQGADLRYALAAGAAIALMAMNGGLHVVQMAVAAVGIFSAVAAVSVRQWRPLLVAAIVGVASLVYAAPKLLPVANFVTSDRFLDARNPTVHPDGMTAGMLVRAYLDRESPPVPHALQRQQWHEYGNYIGPLGAVLIVAALAWAPFRRRARDRWLGVSLALTALLLFALSAGEFHPLAPASILGPLPFFSSFRIPSRFTMAFVPFAVLTVAWLARELLTGRRVSRPLQAAAAIACLCATADLVAHSRRQLVGVFGEVPLFSPFQWGNGPRTLSTDADADPYAPGSPMLRSLMNGRGFYNCYEPLQLRRTAISAAPLVTADGPAAILSTDFTPNRVLVDVEIGGAPSRVSLNQNVAAGWRTTVSPIDTGAVAHGLSVLLPARLKGTIAFEFAPPGLIGGTVIFVVGLALSALTWRRRPLPGNAGRQRRSPE
jgi:hypothetical protein